MRDCAAAIETNSQDTEPTPPARAPSRQCLSSQPRQTSPGELQPGLGEGPSSTLGSPPYSFCLTFKHFVLLALHPWKLSLGQAVGMLPFSPLPVVPQRPVKGCLSSCGQWRKAKTTKRDYNLPSSRAECINLRFGHSPHRVQGSPAVSRSFSPPSDTVRSQEDALTLPCPKVLVSGDTSQPAARLLCLAPRVWRRCFSSQLNLSFVLPR